MNATRLLRTAELSAMLVSAQLVFVPVALADPDRRPRAGQVEDWVAAATAPRVGDPGMSMRFAE